jgi:dihydropteroate synthase
VAGTLRLGRRAFGPDQLLVMAIVDVNLERVRTAVAEGADVVDIVGVGGGVGPEGEVGRSAAFVAAVRDAYPDLVISVCTGRREVAREACAAGADLIREAGAAGADLIREGLAEVAAEFGVGVVCSHNFVARAIGAGIDPERVIVEPAREHVGLGVADLVGTGWPVLVDFTADDGLAQGGGHAAPLARTAVCAWLGARVFRVGAVGQTRRVLRMVSAIRGDIPPARATRGLA